MTFYYVLNEIMEMRCTEEAIPPVTSMPSMASLHSLLVVTVSFSYVFYRGWSLELRILFASWEQDR